MPKGVNHWDDFRILFEFFLLLCGDERPQFVDVDDRTPVQVSCEMEVSHTDFTEVTVCQEGLDKDKGGLGRVTDPGWYLSKLVRWW